jgi:hypothetical protein
VCAREGGDVVRQVAEAGPRVARVRVREGACGLQGRRAGSDSLTVTYTTGGVTFTQSGSFPVS